MKNLRHYISAAIIVNFLCISSVHALVVDFENFATIEGLEDIFIGANIDLNAANDTHRLIGQAFGNGGITFSGGVLLEDPLDSTGMSIIAGDGGSIYYGTADSPSTSITTRNYTNTLSIDITSDENVKSVVGSFVHGLNTNLDMQGISVNYMVNYYSESMGGLNLLLSQNLPAIFDDGASVVGFGLDTGVMGALINLVEITTIGYDFTSTRNDAFEWDFLLASVEFGQGANPVPLPAALPLFISALFGGLMIARPKKSSDHNIAA